MQLMLLINISLTLKHLLTSEWLTASISFCLNWVYGKRLERSNLLVTNVSLLQLIAQCNNDKVLKQHLLKVLQYA